MKIHRLFFCFLSASGLMGSTPLRAMNTPATAANAVNSLGIDLLANTGGPDENALLSPYSIQTALAMTFAGADGATRDEMAKVLHFPKDAAEVNGSFAELQKELAAMEKATADQVDNSKKQGFGGPAQPITISIADRLFGQEGYDFKKPFLDEVKENYGAPLEVLDFKTAPNGAVAHINGWVADQTRKRIQDLIPSGALGKTTRLVLVNAIYLKAAWQSAFKEAATSPKPFHIGGKEPKDVPTMFQESFCGYEKGNGYTVIALPYVGDDLQFLILLPDDVNGLAALVKRIDARLLADCAGIKQRKVLLYMPKFKMEPPTMPLGKTLQALGMKSAFDIPRGSANFDLMATRRPDDYLCISEVFHKTFLSLDENGTEAAAATAVAMMAGAAIMREPPSPEVHVDHPFLFAIQHRKSGACIFLGRMADPR